ncbi:MAG: hypothetical protein ACRCZ0_10825 [Cetobacterium sp.]
MVIIDGKYTLGGLGSQYYEANTKEAEIARAMAETIEAGNTAMAQDGELLVAFLRKMEKEVERINGQPIPVKTHNVFFSEGGLMTSAQGFESYYDNFTMKRSIPLQVKAFGHSQQEVLDAKNKKISLLSKDAEDLEAITRAYVSNYNPFIRLLALMTGSSMTTKIPTVATAGTDENFTRAFGWLRGENVSDFLPATQGITHANHYRCKKGATLTSDDIVDLVDLIESYDTYSRQGVVALAHPRVISKLGAMYGDSLNQDRHIIDGVITPNFLGVSWLECSQLNKEFIIFVDGGKVNDLIIKGVNPDAEQRGLKIIAEANHETYQYNGVNSAKAVIFDEEYLVALRQAGGVLDIVRTEATGLMGATSETALNTFAKLVEEMYKR